MLRHVPFYQRLARFAYTVYIFNSLSGLSPVALGKVGSIIGFLPFVGLEGALARIFSDRGARVFMMQHALFDRDENYKPIDKLIYEPSKFVELLCWGAYSARKLQGLPYKRVHLAGNLRSYAAIARKAVSTKVERIYVILPAPIYLESSQKLIQLIGALAVKNVVYRLHPSDTNEYSGMSPNQIDRSGTPLREVVNSERFDIFISSNSTAYYDVYLFGGKCLNFVSKDSRTFVDIGRDQFHDLDSLHEKIAHAEHEPDDAVQEALVDLFGIGLNNYREIVVESA
jgi:hypothetical protein